MTRTLPLLALLLAGCGADPILYPVPAVPSGDRIGVSVGSVEVLDVSLPLYADIEEITFEQVDGSLLTSEEVAWADDPQRAVTLELARVLGTVTRATVAPTPWPFESFAEARVDVRVEEFVAGIDGRFRISGIWYAGTEERDRSGRFAIAIPYHPEGGVRAIAIARAQAVRDLARVIAAQGL
ncbi:PqiC family protein [Hasllibacter halocynthiae]|nr:ABC-type transport auxiliary lipoprotein family protein [Hasllibacter halocynthiae]